MSPTTNGIKETQRHKDYYIDGGDLYLDADGGQTHFLVHSYFFLRESQYFRRELHVSPGQKRKGSEPSSALGIHPKDASADDFATLLKVFYNPKFTVFDDMTTDDWFTVLNLAHKWDFPEVKALAIRELEKIELDDIPRIAMYVKNNVDNRYIMPLYTRICAREKVPTEEEAALLDHKTLTFIFRARERLRSPAHANGGGDEDELISPLPDGMGFNTVLKILGGMLKIDVGPFDVLDSDPKSKDGATTTNKTNGSTGKPNASGGGNQRSKKT
jgi:hypothetical protein